jgi:trehalose synthase-fused probable maltokinase
MPSTIEMTQPWAAFAIGAGREVIAREALPAYLSRQRWFPAGTRTIARVSMDEAVALPLGNACLFVAGAEYDDGGQHRFAVPVAFAEGAEAERVRRDAPERVIAEVTGGTPGILHDDMTHGLGGSLLMAMAGSLRWPLSRGVLAGEKTNAFDGLLGQQDVRGLTARRITAEQSNTSVVFGDRLIVKLIRRLEPGLNPDYEIGRHLTDRVPFPGVPALAGAVLWRGAKAEPTVLAVAQAFVPGAVVLRERIVSAIADYMRGEGPRVRSGTWMASAGACRELFDGAAALGAKTAALHLALSDSQGDPAFVPEPATAGDLAAIARAMQAQVDAAREVLAPRVADLPPASAALAARILGSRRELAEAIAGVARIPPGVQRIRVHGDYQLDQVLVAGGQFVVIDFEGEPLRPLADRRAKFLAVKDVAGMARSYSYAAYAALFDVAGDDEDLAERLEPIARWWQAEATASFVRGYREAAGRAPFLPADPAAFDALLDAFLVEKATYELRYEFSHRPRWLRIPLRGVADLLDRLERR